MRPKASPAGWNLAPDRMPSTVAEPLTRGFTEARRSRPGDAWCRKKFCPLRVQRPSLGSAAVGAQTTIDLPAAVGIVAVNVSGGPAVTIGYN